MNTVFKKSLLIAAVSSLLAAPLAQATNGYFAHGYSTKEKGLAGAGAAYSQDALAAANNPAGMAFVGERMDIGQSLFSPSPRGYTVTGAPPAPAGAPASAFCSGGVFPPTGGQTCQFPFSVNPGSVDSENDFFLIPSFGINWQLDNSSTVGISSYGNGGMDTEYKGGSATTLNPNTGVIDDTLPGPFGSGTAGVSLAQLFVNASYARKINDDSAWGASLIFALQRFNAQGLTGFGAFSANPANLGVNQHDYSNGFGFKLGYQGKVADKLSVGVSYQSEISMSEFDIYSGLFAEGGDFDIPSTYTLGLAYEVGDNGKVLVDVQRINYTDVAAVSNPISNVFPDANGNPQCVDPLNAASFGIPPGGPGCFGGARGAGFGWEDITIVKLGYQLMLANNTHRFGFSHTTQPIPESETLFNILAPGVIENHITYGLTMPVGTDQEFNFAAMFAPNTSVKGANPFDGGATQIEIEMTQWELQAGWAWKY